MTLLILIPVLGISLQFKDQPTPVKTQIKSPTPGKGSLAKARGMVSAQYDTCISCVTFLTIIVIMVLFREDVTSFVHVIAYCHLGHNIHNVHDSVVLELRPALNKFFKKLPQEENLVREQAWTRELQK